VIHLGNQHLDPDEPEDHAQADVEVAEAIGRPREQEVQRP
jgi:hypothetical protein